MTGKDVDFESDRFSGRGDDFYALLMKTHEGLDDEESMKLNARLVLILANQIGEMDILERLLTEGRKGVGGKGECEE